MMIAIIDYGVGNLRSVQKAFAAVDYEAVITSDPEVVQSASAIVLPGVGAFGAAAANLCNTDLLPAVLEAVRQGRPFLGICVGMQLLFEQSEECFGGIAPKGLGLIKGSVRLFPAGLKVPQIGWNQLHMTKESPLFAGVPEGSHVYFVHSYYCAPIDASCVATTTEYGIDFCSSIHERNLMAIQFHPEKSGQVGLRILRNFGEWVSKC